MSVKVAVMQPYFFPYMGYFQLIGAVDKFVLFDDVNFIKKGWIHRNRILRAGQEAPIQLRLAGASQNKKINEISLFEPEACKSQIVDVIRAAYSKASASNLEFVCDVVLSHQHKLAAYNGECLRAVSKKLGYSTELTFSSDLKVGPEFKGQARVLKICEILGATDYLNLPGGVDLYDSAEFRARGMTLSFLKSNLAPYKQAADAFVPGLSILDFLLCSDADPGHPALRDYQVLLSEALRAERS